MVAIQIKRNVAVRWTSGLAVLITAFLLLAGVASADTSMQTITSAGPLTNIYIGNQLSCQVQHSGFDPNTPYEFYSPTSTTGNCGTFLSVGGTLYGQPVAAGTAFTAVSQPAVTGAGTTASPYSVTTTVTAGTGAQVQEVDSYVVGDESYLTTITVTNTGRTTLTGFLYRGADCYLHGSDAGFGYAPGSGAVACTANANNSPAGPLEEFAPVSGGTTHYVEDSYSTVWSDIGAQTDLPNTCADCSTSTAEDNGEAINWDVSIPAGQSATYSMLNNISDTGQFVGAPTAVTGPATPSSPTTATLTGSVNPGASTVTDCHFDFGPTPAYGSSAPCAQTVGGGTAAVPVSADLTGLTPNATYHYRLAATNSDGQSLGNDQTVATPAAGATTTTPPPPVPAQPAVVVAAPPAVAGPSAAGLSGLVNPEGLLTTAHFEYGLDAQYSAGGAQLYDQTTPDQALGADFAAHAVSASVTGLVPNAVYDARLVASNADGTVTGPNQTFRTGQAPTPPAPTLGKTTNLQLVSGLVLVKPPGGSSSGARSSLATVDKGTGFVPLTQARQVPIGSQIDARRGVLDLVDNSGQQHHDQSVHLAGGLFTVTQTKSGVAKGLTTLALNEGAFPGAPSFTKCPSTGKLAHTTGGPQGHSAGLSSKVLQTLRASDHNGKFRTKGRYSSGTVRGTDWGTKDQCNGTLTIVHRGTVDVADFGLRKTIAVHAGHTYLAKPPSQDKKKKK